MPFTPKAWIGINTNIIPILLQSHRCHRPSRHHPDPKEERKHKGVSFCTTMVHLFAQCYSVWRTNCCLPGPPAPTSTSPTLQSTAVQRSLSHGHSPLQELSGNTSELLSIASLCSCCEVIELTCLPDIQCGLASVWLHKCC